MIFLLRLLPSLLLIFLPVARAQCETPFCQDDETAHANFQLLQMEKKLSRPSGTSSKELVTQRCEKYFIDEEGRTPPPRGPLETGLRRKIERIDAAELTPEIFFKWYVHPNRAVVISGASDALFEGFPDQWTPSALVNSPYSELKQPVKQSQSRVVGFPDNNLSIKEIHEEKTRAIMFEKYTFGDMESGPEPGLHDGDPQGWLYQRTYFRKFRSTNAILNASTPSDIFTLHFSNQGGALPHSHTQTLNLCMYGSKRWIMVDPFDYTGLNVTNGRETFELMDVWGPEANQTAQEWYTESALGELNRLRIPYYDFILNAGEAIFIPSYWTHATMDMCRETVGVELKGHLVTSDWIPEGTTRFLWNETVPFVDPYSGSS